MKYKKKYIVASILVLILLIFLRYLYLIQGLKIINTDYKASENGQMTEKEKIDILSKTSDVEVSTSSDIEKKKILNQTTTKTKPINNLSTEEVLQILNKTN